MVEGTGLENRRDREVTVGSNPTPSATHLRDERSPESRRATALAIRGSLLF